MKRTSLALVAAGAFALGSCSENSTPPSPPTSQETAASAGGSLNGRVVGVAYVEMSARAVVVREAPDGALTACFWNATPSQANPLGCVPLD